MSIRGKQKGVAAVEFALLLVLLVPIAFGGTEFGRMFTQYNSLLKATRQAARAMSLNPGNVNEATARCLAVFGRPVCTGLEAPLMSGLAPGNVVFTYDTVNNGVATFPVVRVEIRDFEFASLVPWVVPTLTFAPVGTTMRQVAP